MARRLSIAVVLIMLAQSALGLLLPAQYRDVAWIRASWFGNDWITLAVAVPLLIVALGRASRGSARGLLLWLGALGYAIYNYAFYLLGAALNTFFPLYVLAVVLAAAALMIVLTGLDAGDIARRFRPDTPVRLLGGSLMVVGTGLALVWTIFWARYVFVGRPTPVEPKAFQVVAALDLTLMVPALAVGGVLLWRARPSGYVIAAIASIQGALYLLVLSTNSAIAIWRGLAAAPGELPLWGILALFTMAVAAGLLRNVREGTSPPGPAD